MEDKYVEDRSFFGKKTALTVAGVLFLLFGLVHLWRVVTGAQFIIGATMVPMSVSVLLVIVAFLLAVWMFMAAGCCCKKFYDKSSCCFKKPEDKDKGPGVS